MYIRPFFISNDLESRDTLPNSSLPKKPLWSPLLAVVGCLLLSNFTIAYSAPLEADSIFYAKESSVIRVVQFSGNFNVNNATLEGLIRTKTNRELFEIPRFTLRYFLWKVNNKWGEPPQKLKREVIANDIERIQLFYRALGFFDAEVDTSLSDMGKNRAKVVFKIDEGNQASIDSVYFRGVPSELIQNGVFVDFIRKSKLNKKIINDTTYLSQRFYREETLDIEYQRLLGFLKDNGYASVKQDSVNILVKSKEDSLKLDVMFDIKAGRIFNFGNVEIQLNEPESQSIRQSKFYIDSTVALAPKKLIIKKNDVGQTKFSTIKDQILFRAGDKYDQSAFDISLSRLQQLGMLSVLGHGTGRPDESHSFDSLYVPMYIRLQSLPKHRISTELFGLRRFGFGTGANLIYANNNVRGGAERLQVSFNGSIEFLTDNSITRLQGITDSLSTSLIESRSLQSFETSLSYSVPRLAFPFNRSNIDRKSINTRTEYSITHSVANQIFFDINLELRLNWRFEVQHSQSRSSYLDLLELEWLDTNPQQAYLEQLERIYQDPVLVSFAREDFRPQFTSIIRYRHRNSTTNPIKRDEGYFREYSLAVAGNIPYFLDRYLITPNSVENSLPALFGISGNRINYSQFVKLTADIRTYKPLDPYKNGIWASRFFVGLIHAYGQNPDVPINRRFFAGGNNDIRSYNVFRLGPGALSTQEIPRNGGEIKLMAQTEIRQLFITNLLAANWYSVMFAETGNVWYGFRDLALPNEQLALTELGRFRFDEFYKQLPVVGGIGIRLDWDFVVLRMDLAFRFRDVQEGWFQNSSPFFAFGIGHSF